MSASRRDLLTMGAAAGVGAFANHAGAATFGNADDPAHGVPSAEVSFAGEVDRQLFARRQWRRADGRLHALFRQRDRSLRRRPGAVLRA